ncbi:MAG: hypothetical protein AAF226_15700, partial [Verrucomicrobiota bacterium]
MKSALDLAMERHGGGDVKPLSDEQKAALATINEKFKAKIAEREVFLGDLIKKATENGDFGEIAQLEEQMRREVQKLERDRDAEKDA